MEASTAGPGRTLQEVERVPEQRSPDDPGLPLRSRSLPLGSRDLTKQSALLHQVSENDSIFPHVRKSIGAK